MSLRRIASIVMCCALAVVLGGKSSPDGCQSKTDAQTCCGKCKAKAKPCAGSCQKACKACPSNADRTCDGTKTCEKMGKTCPGAAAKKCCGKCKGAAKKGAQDETPGKVMCPTRKGQVCDGSEACLKRGKECPKANYPGTVAKHKMMALTAATKTHSLKEIRGAAKALGEAMAKHRPVSEKMAKQEDYVELETAAMAAVHKVGVQRSTMDATRAAMAIGSTCADCHAAYK